MRSVPCRAARRARTWHRFEIRRIEDLANAFFGADLEAVQLEGPSLRGSLAFAARGGIVFSSGLIRGNFEVLGRLGLDAVTLVAGLRVGRGSRWWLDDVRDGQVCVLLPGGRQDAICCADSLYIAASLPIAGLHAVAARRGWRADAILKADSGTHCRPLPPRTLESLRRQALQLHAGSLSDERLDDFGYEALLAIVEHYARHPLEGDRKNAPRGRARIIHSARAYIRSHLDAPITLDAIAAAAGTSHRSLARAFNEVLRESPGSYVRRRRLHRIRQELISQPAARRAISAIAARWGMPESGRMSARYRSLFGELPAQTRAHSSYGGAGAILL